jgi:hypothetical protein
LSILQRLASRRRHDDVQSLRAAKANPYLSPAIKSNPAYFDTTGIVYSYSLDGTETNGLTFNFDIIKPLTHPGTFTHTPSAGNTWMRDNVRTFTISDSFGKLIAPVNDDYFDFPQLGVDIEGSVSMRWSNLSSSW